MKGWHWCWEMRGDRAWLAQRDPHPCHPSERLGGSQWAGRSPDLIHSDFPSFGRGVVEAAERAGQTWMQGQVWPGPNPTASAEHRRWEHPTWFPAKYLGALPRASEGFVALLIAINGSKRGSRHPPGSDADEARAVPALQDLPCKSPATTCAVVVTSSQK